MKPYSKFIEEFFLENEEALVSAEQLYIDWWGGKKITISKEKILQKTTQTISRINTQLKKENNGKILFRGGKYSYSSRQRLDKELKELDSHKKLRNKLAVRRYREKKLQESDDDIKLLQKDLKWNKDGWTEAIKANNEIVKENAELRKKLQEYDDVNEKLRKEIEELKAIGGTGGADVKEFEKIKKELEHLKTKESLKKMFRREHKTKIYPSEIVSELEASLRKTHRLSLAWLEIWDDFISLDRLSPYSWMYMLSQVKQSKEKISELYEKMEKTIIVKYEKKNPPTDRFKNISEVVDYENVA